MKSEKEIDLSDICMFRKEELTGKNVGVRVIIYGLE
jgi:hypothetical protein